MSDAQPLLGLVSKQTATIFAAGLLAGLSTLYLPSLLSPSTSTLRSLLFLLYPLATHSLAIGRWWTARHQPALSPLSSLRPDSPLRYTTILLLTTLLFCQLLFSPHITHSIWAPLLVYLGHLLAHLPFIAHATLTTATTLHLPPHTPTYYLLLLAALLTCIGCGVPYIGSEYALSRPQAGLAWYVLRLVVEVCYALMMTSGVSVNGGKEKEKEVVVVGGDGVEEEEGGGLSSSSVWYIAHAVRIGLWAALAYVCRLYANGQTQLW